MTGIQALYPGPTLTVHFGSEFGLGKHSVMKKIPIFNIEF